MLVDTYTTLRPPLTPETSTSILHTYDPSALLSLSFGVESSAEEVLMEATMGATAGAGVVDLFIFAAWSL